MWQSYFAVDVAAVEKVVLLLAIDAGGDVAQRVRVGIDKAMARRDIAGGPDAQQAQAGAAGMRFVHALIQLAERVADIREAVHLAAQRVFQIFVGQERGTDRARRPCPCSLIA